MSKKLITGVIQSNDKPVIFSVNENEYEFSFMTDSIYSLSGKNTPIKISTQNSFICGKTHSNLKIAIYFGKYPLEIWGTSSIETPAYIMSTSNVFDIDIMEYEAISFQGGTLNDVFYINGFDTDYIDGETVVKYNDDSLIYFLETEKYKMKIDIHSSVSEHYGIHNKSICNKDVILTLEFDKPQPIISFFDHYNRIRELLSFMTFRKNVGFEKITLLKTHPEIKQLMSSAEVFIRNDIELTDKSYYKNISFQDLGVSLPNLLKLFYDSDDRKNSISLGFIPSSDRDVNVMNYEKIRSICSALECELSFANTITVEKNIELGELVEAVKQTVREFRKTHCEMSKDTYNLVFSSISHWSFSLAEKLCSLYHKYNDEILILNKSSVVITDQSIKEFVKYRNDITHGRYRTPDVHISLTAHYMRGLVYCCVLERIGISRAEIKEWCNEKLLQ